MPKERIMLAMLKTLGDVVLATTLCRELKRDSPEAEITVYTHEPYGEIFANNPDVFEVMKGEWQVDGLLFAMTSGKYDTVHAPYQVRPECNSWHQDEVTRHQHLVDFYWRRMGMVRPIEERECHLFPSERDFADSRRHVSLDAPRVALHSTTGVPTKDWPFFDQLAEELRRAGYGCVQVGGAQDKSIHGAVDLRGKMRLLELAAFLSQCSAFVGLDSGVSYIADAVKIPTIVIQGSTNPVTSGPISDRVVHLFAKETGYADCQVVRCHANCRHEVNCITKVTVEDVLGALEVPLSGWLVPVPTGVA